MSTNQACAVYRDRLPAMAGGEVDQLAVAHVAGCTACRAELAQWRLAAGAVRLAADRTPEPSPGVLEGVWARLDGKAAAGRLPVRLRVPGWLRHAVLLVAGQAPLVRRQLWAASAVVMAVGGLLSATAYTPDAAAGILGVLAPLIAAVGLALVYGPEVDPGLEVALATPTSPRSVLLARMTLVFGFDLGLALAVNTVVTLARGDVAWWGLISQWLGPMLLLASVALLMSVTLGAAAAITTALTLWTVRLVTLTEAGQALADGAVRAVVDTVWSTGAVTLVVTAALMLAAVLLVDQPERWA